MLIISKKLRTCLANIKKLPAVNILFSRSFYFGFLLLGYCFSYFDTQSENSILFIAKLFVGILLWTASYKTPSWTRVSKTLALLATFVGLFPGPVFENDFYRYFIDGLHQTNNSPVYSVSPANSPLIESQPKALYLVGFPEEKTVYSPVVIRLFGYIATLSHADLDRFILLSRRLALILLTSGFFILLRSSGAANAFFNSLFIVHHPLIHNELIRNIHFDYLVLFFICMMLAARPSKRLFYISAATLIKYVTVILIPLELSWDKACVRKIALIILSLGSSFSLFLLCINNSKELMALAENLNYFSLTWEMNSGFFRWLRNFIDFLLPENPLISVRLSQIIGLGIVLATQIYLKLKTQLKYSTLVFTTLFLLPLVSAVANPWYFLWSLPALIHSRSSNVVLFLSYAPLSIYYLFFNTQADLANVSPSWWLDLEHILIWTLFLFGLKIEISSRAGNSFNKELAYITMKNKSKRLKSRLSQK